MDLEVISKPIGVAPIKGEQKEKKKFGVSQEGGGTELSAWFRENLLIPRARADGKTRILTQLEPNVATFVFEAAWHPLTQ